MRVGATLFLLGSTFACGDKNSDEPQSDDTQASEGPTTTATESTADSGATTGDGTDTDAASTTDTDTDTDTDAATTDSNVVADCDVDAADVECGAIRSRSECRGTGGSTGSESGSGGDSDCEEQNTQVESCVVEAALAGDSFGYRDSDTSGSGQYGSVTRFVIGRDGMIARTDASYDDLCGEVRASLHQAVDFSTCGDFECVEDLIRRAPQIKSCGPEEQCG